ncbi:GNAT family protein [Microbacterium sp. KSW-18]|uniref:GNAT family protein n=1 Tax=Microbacterium aquilitoris TaxID=3067307 RepID=A0ABU3GEZ3_9MICO|nr:MULTISPECIES: GNAT family protein [unclassified Microbacterium]MDT3329261.1 GNAT family protein [Microbacterium sp. KSW-18]
MSPVESALAAQPVLTTERLTLVQLGPDYVETTLAGLEDPDALRLTGTRGEFSRERVNAHLQRLPGAPDRADFAILDRDGMHIGEVVLNELDLDNLAMSYRIALTDSTVRGLGYGTEAGRAVVEWGFSIGLHRIYLEVYAFNPSAQRSYEKIGFRHEGRAREALLWDDEWTDAVLMSILATDPLP